MTTTAPQPIAALAPAAGPGPLLHPFAKPAADASSFTRIVRGEGALVFDDQGKRYVDAMASLWYCNVGHGRTEIARAVADQIAELENYHLFERFVNPRAEELAARLVELAPVPGSRVFLTSGGSEAVDTALKLSRVAHAQAGHPERTIVASRRPSYHGVTYGGMALTGLPLNRKDFGTGMADVVQIDKDDLDGVRQVFEQNPGRVAAVFAEPVIGAGGVWPPAPGYLEGLRALCDEHGAHLVLDEVICGFGRVGSMFAGSHFGVRADLTTFAKGVSSGYLPLGGVLVGPAVHEALSADPSFVLRHGYTYSGHAAACAAALVCLDITEREGLFRESDCHRRASRDRPDGAEGRRPAGRCPWRRGAVGRQPARGQRPSGRARPHAGRRRRRATDRAVDAGDLSPTGDRGRRRRPDREHHEGGSDVSRPTHRQDLAEGANP